MDIKYKFVEYIVLLEYFLIIIIICAAIFSKLLTDMNNKNNQKITLIINKHLTNLIESNQLFDLQKFPPKGHRLDLLLFILSKFSAQSDHAHLIKLELIRTVILPLARIAAHSSNWVSQFYAARSFELHAELDDELLIKRLINNKVPLVRIAALRATLKHGVEQASDDIISHIQNQPRLTQDIYIQAFNDASLSTWTFITKFLKTASSPSTRLTCYRILLNYPPQKIDWDITSDIYSGNKELKLGALRLMGHMKQKSAIPILVEQLQDNHWETKIVVLHALGYLPAQEFIPQIVECLYNENWWVKLHAAQALKNLGEKGEEALIFNQISIEPKTLEVVRHVLKIL
jgi:hypothetical protein